MSFSAPIGSDEERNSGVIWPGRWFDATGFAKKYSLGYHTGADLNLNFPHWDGDAHSDVYAIGAGRVTYAKIYSKKVWGAIVVIDHGTVDGKPLFSRYGHVENIIVEVGQEVEIGDKIASVGNGEGLFPYHLHFDISNSAILGEKPWHWPGDKAALLENYVNPQEWLQTHLTSVAEGTGYTEGTGETESTGETEDTVEVETKAVPPVTQEYFVTATLGMRVRNDPGLSGVQVGSLNFGSPVSIEEASKVDQDSYTWGRISEGQFTGDWIAMGKADQSDTFLSTGPPNS